MTFLKPSLALAMSGILALSACTDPAQSPNPNQDRAAAVGAGAGALIGAIVSDDGDRGEGALLGAVVGGVIGAGVGYSLDQQERDLRRQIDNENVGITNTGESLIVNLPQDILFAVDSFAVRPDLRNDLQAVAANLRQYPASTIRVVGHTDSDGDAGYNQQLSERRASAVAGVLLDAGVPAERVRTLGLGESQPVASNLSAAGKAQNRRVEIVIVPTSA